MQISLPPTITRLTKTIEAVSRNQSVGDVLSAAASTLAAYNKLPAHAKAAYLLRLRQEKAQLQHAFAAAKHQQIANYLKHPTPEAAGVTAELSAQAGDAESADKFFEQQAELTHDPAVKAVANAHRGEVLLKSAGGRAGIDVDRIERAKLHFETATRLRPDMAVVNQKGAEKLAAAKGGIEADGDFNAEGLKQLLAGDFDAAKEAFEAAMEFDPDNPEVLNNLALACCYAGQFGRAAKLAMRALKLHPSLKTNNLVLATAGMRAAIDDCKNS